MLKATPDSAILRNNVYYLDPLERSSPGHVVRLGDAAHATTPGIGQGAAHLRNPANRSRAVPLTYDQFKYGFANMLDDDEAKELYAKYSVAGPGKVLFQAASANLSPWTEYKVDTKNPERGPMLILAGEKDHTVPHAIANASFKHERRNDGVTEIVEIEGRGHSLTIDGGWREVCDKALAFVKRFV